MKLIKGKKMYLKDTNMIKNVFYVLLSVVLLSVIGYETYIYSISIEHKKEMQELENEKLRLEIEILKKYNGNE